MSCTWTTLLLTAFASSLGFNLDTEKPTHFHMDGAEFGHSVVQYDGSWVVVGAPKEIRATNQMGGLYRCGYHIGKCEPVHLQVPSATVNMSLGLSLTAATNPSRLLACGPTVHHTCRENIYLTGLCFLLSSSFQQNKRFPASQQECPRQDQDIVFLIDGSGSISPKNFGTMLKFVRAVMSQFHQPSTQFSLMQFSSTFRTHFTFNDFISSSSPLELLDSVRQLGGYTHTATAIKLVITKLFTPQSGARKDATRVLIVITDGKKEGDNLGYNAVIPLAEAAGIIRYAIGVGQAFYNAYSLGELKDIASMPYQDHIFNVENFDALKDIQNQLKEKIFAIEGTETGRGSSFELEMSQEGFSAVFTPDGPVLGAVGSFSWSGGAFLYPSNMKPTFINMSQENVDMRDAYLGYSTALAFWKGIYSLVLGAPRHQHTGKVVIFTQESRQWRPKSEVSGKQIGSYFGASLCSVDMDRDGSTDLVLIGAPHYYEQTRGGQVSVCPMPSGRTRWKCEATLRGEQGHPWGRFGAALTVLGDVNGDRVTDVAIGAPGEEENRGAVYVFHGASKLDISPSPSQRISGSQLVSRLQHFGQSLSGGQDLTQDGLADLAVGSKGHVLLLRTRPILRMLSTIRFSPGEIARSVFECQEHGASVQTLGDATVCLHVYESPKTQLGDLQSSVTFDLALDAGRLSSRAIFKETKTQVLTRVKTLGLSKYCETVKLLLPACVEDSVTPITLRLNFSLVGLPISSYKNLQPMLAVDEQTYFTASLPFEKNCGADHICQDDLGIIFDFPDLKTLVVGSDLEFNVDVTVSNDGEDSYGTRVTLLYPVGLSFRRASEGQVLLREKEENQRWQRPMHLTCDSTPSRSQGLWRTICSVSHVIFRGGAQMTFLATFDVSPKAELGDRLLLTARVDSENDTPKTTKATFQLELPVKYAVYTVISRGRRYGTSQHMMLASRVTSLWEWGLCLPCSPAVQGTLLASCNGPSLDVEKPIVFREDAAGFGQTVVQFGGSRVVVGAPLEVVAANQTGQLYDCAPATGMCQPLLLPIPLEAMNVSLGLSLVAATNHSQLLACGPTAQRACAKSMYAKGFCLLLGSSLQFIQAVPATLPECPVQEMDIAFLIDGSGSIHQSDFRRMKAFVKALMDQFASTSTSFSLMQYSNILKTHFTFTQFWSTSNPQSLVDPIVQLQGLTFTATGIQKVVKELFHSKNGAREDAKKILIVITDGQKYRDPLEYSDVIPQAEKASITRYAIGVGDAFQEPTALQELNTIGSAPPQDHVFKVDNFAALGSIQKQLQEKIFAIEGTQSRASSSFEHEMSQEGFSSALTMDGPVLGAVGSFSWSGGAFLYPSNMRPTFINMSQENVDMRDAYLGYSTALAFWKGVYSLVLGAPRHQHTGKVVIFTQESRQWRPKSEVSGKQIGSYFGASLCSVDMDRDGSTDLVLIGAPHYYEQTRGGQVSVCPMPSGRTRWQCEATLRGEQGHPWGRFGAALTVLGDVNGDRVTDVAIGAPGEEENRGAVYVFHGASKLDISPSPSQRVTGSQLSLRLQYFGQSLSGGQDLTEDGLVDLAVGAQGHMLLLRSLPLLKVGINIRFVPVEVAKAVYQCWKRIPAVLEAGEAIVCITIQKGSPDQLGDLQSPVRYDLVLDPGRLISRAVFDETKKWTLARRKPLGLGEHCETIKLLLPDCVEDMVNPIILRLNFSLVGDSASSRNLHPVLAVGSQDHVTASLPFQKNCKQEVLCEGDLSISFNFSGLQTLVVGSSPELTVTVTVRNEGEDSYGTVVTFYYPAGLSYRRVTPTQKQPDQYPLRLACEAEPTDQESLRSISCSINHPIFQEGAQSTFKITFDVSYKAFLGDRLLMRANAGSENNKPQTNKTAFQLELPVKYAVYTVIRRQEDSSKHFNFSHFDGERRKAAEHRYRVNNLSQWKLPISVNFWVPILLNGVAVWEVAMRTSAQGVSCASEKEPPLYSDFLTQIQRHSVLDCSIADCLHLHCDIPSLGIQDELDFILKGNLSFSWVSQTLQKKVVVMSVAEITFNKSVYSQLPGQEAFLRAQVETVLEEFEVYDPIPLIAGSSVGGLLLLALITAVLYKLGFFKRRYKEMLDRRFPEPDLLASPHRDSKKVVHLRLSGGPLSSHSTVCKPRSPKPVAPVAPPFSSSSGVLGNGLCELDRLLQELNATQFNITDEIMSQFPSSKMAEREEKEDQAEDKSTSTVSPSTFSVPSKPSATSATLELDRLMASLSDFRVQNHLPASGPPQPPAASSTQEGCPSPPGQTSKGSLDTMLGLLQSDLSRRGVPTQAKGLCGSCNKPIAGQVVTALGRAWHPEHFVCSGCSSTLGGSSFFENGGAPFCTECYFERFSPRCGFCNQPIRHKMVTALGTHWHPEHFCCVSCGEPFGEEGFHEREGRPYCRRDFLQLFAPRCQGCQGPILDNYISALSALWHPDCFVCRECLAPFSGGSFFEHEGRPLCENHFHAQRGSLCATCGLPVTGRCVSALGRRFHPDHFTCTFCLRPLTKGSFQERASKPYCQPCFLKLFG
ncbi:integrin alpha-D [Sigmodon hispidus]